MSNSIIDDNNNPEQPQAYCTLTFSESSWNSFMEMLLLSRCLADDMSHNQLNSILKQREYAEAFLKITKQFECIPLDAEAIDHTLSLNKDQVNSLTKLIVQGTLLAKYIMDCSLKRLAAQRAKASHWHELYILFNILVLERA